MPIRPLRLPPVLRSLPAAGLLRALPLHGLGALASRFYVYLSGFLAVFLLAAHVAPARFGAYSIYQSVLEAALVIGTLGSSLLFSRHATGPGPRIQRGDLVRTLAIGLPIALLLALGMLALQRVPASATALVLVAATLAVFSFNSLRLAYSRGLGHAGLLNLESGVRSSILVLGVAGLAVLGHAGDALDVPQLLAINLFAFVLVAAAIVRAGSAGRPPRGAATLALSAQGGATIYSLLLFLLRKSDLLVVAFFMPLGYVGAFKLAFLLAEAPSQFVQAFLYTKTPAMRTASAEQLDASVFRLARQSFLLGCGLFAGLAALIVLAAPLLKVGREALEIFLCIAPYFLLRTYTVHHEMLLALRVPVASLARWALLEVGLRLLSYAVVIRAFPGQPHYVFLLACVSDFVLYELRMRLEFGTYPIVRMARGLARGAWRRQP